MSDIKTLAVVIVISSGLISAMLGMIAIGVVRIADAIRRGEGE